MNKLMRRPKIEGLIFELRGQRIMLDRHLAMIYGVSTKVLNQAVKRNKQRFPKDFMFCLTREERGFLRSQIVTLEGTQPKITYLPYAFTRNGANMLSAVIKSPNAVRRSIQIMRAFSVLEEAMSNRTKGILRSPKILEKISTHSKAIMYLFKDSKVKTKQINKLHEIQKEMINLMQQMVFSSLKQDYLSEGGTLNGTVKEDK